MRNKLVAIGIAIFFLHCEVKKNPLAPNGPFGIFTLYYNLSNIKAWKYTDTDLVHYNLNDPILPNSPVIPSSAVLNTFTISETLPAGLTFNSSNGVISGTPTFLIELTKKKNFDIGSLPIEISEIGFSTYDIEQLQVLPLLFQTGYLTVKNYDKESMMYTLDYPNFEVKNAFLNQLTVAWTNKESPESYIQKLIRSLRAKDFETFFETLKALFANIDYDLHIPQEKYYQTIFYLVFTLVGLKNFAEVKTNIGRIDVVLIDSEIYLFEFKLNDTATKALEQIKKNKYFEKYLSSEKKLYMFGVEFKDKNIGEWILEG